MKLHAKQAEIAESNKRFRVVCSGRRFGKTVLAVEEIKGRALYTESRVCYIAPNYQQARDIAWEMLKKEMTPIAANINESRLELTVHNKIGSKSMIFLRGWESIETLRGQYFDFLVIDEIAMMRNFWIGWEEVLRPTLTDKRGSVLFISTPKGFNHFYDLYNLEGEDENFQSFHFTSYDNPYIPADEIDIAKKQMTIDRFAQEYMADFKKAEGLVYKEFNREYHAYSELEDGSYTRMLGIDFGYTNPTAVIEILKDGDNHYWIESEWYKKEQTNEQIAEVAKSFKPQMVYADPAAPDKIAELRRHSVNMREVKKGKGSVVAGIDRVRELLKQGRLHINKRCKNVLYEFETYHYPENDPNKNDKEEPVKENDHAMDAIRYVIMTNDKIADRADVKAWAVYKEPEIAHSYDLAWDTEDHSRDLVI